MKYGSYMGKKRYRNDYANLFLQKSYRPTKLSGYVYGNWKIETRFVIKHGLTQNKDNYVYGFTPIPDVSTSNYCIEGVHYRTICLVHILYSANGKIMLDKLNGLYDEMRVYAIKIRWKPFPKEKQTTQNGTVGVFYWEDCEDGGKVNNQFSIGLNCKNKLSLPMNVETKRFIWINLKDAAGRYGTAAALLKSNAGALHVCGMNDITKDQKLCTNVMGEVSITLYLRCRKKN
jgi:hypothetical protein